MKVGRGLFTKVERKKNDYIVGFPGYWMESRVLGLAASRETTTRSLCPVPTTSGHLCEALCT